jgi:hypothetical protein
MVAAERCREAAMAEKLHKLAALRLVRDAMRTFEDQHRERIARGDNPAEAARDAAQWALDMVVRFFLDEGIEAHPLMRLLHELAALSQGASPSAMLAALPTPHRRPDAPAIEGIKGRLAAIMEFRQKRSGLSRREAGEWVARQATLKLEGRLGPVTRAAVDSWLVKWGGELGPWSAGREGYLTMRAQLAELKPAEGTLKTIIEAFAKSLPVREST